MDELKQIVGHNILKLRAYHHLTQYELGEKLNYSDKAISKWERGESVPDVFVLRQMGELFDVTVDYLITDHSNEPVAPIKPGHNIMYTISLIAITGVWAVAILAFVIFWLFGQTEWMIFVYSVPASLIVQLVFSSISGNTKSRLIIISALIWSIIASIYLQCLQYNWWVLFFIGIPAQIIVILSFNLHAKMVHK